MFKNNEKKYYERDDFVQSTKKFVFQIYPENVKFIESLSYQEKQLIINELISNHLKGQQPQFSLPEINFLKIKITKKIVGQIVILLISFFIISFIFQNMMQLSKSNDRQMTRNFEKLYVKF